MAAVPTPPEPAWTSTVWPGSSRTWRVTGIQAVRNVSRNAGALCERRALGQREQPLRVHRNLLRIAAAGEQGDDAAAVRRLAGGLHARRRRQRRRLRIVPLADEDVEKVHSRGTNTQQGLSLGHVRIGHVAYSQLLRPTGLLDDDCLHSALLTICVQRADASSAPSAS